MKRILAAGTAICLSVLCSVGAFASELPTGTTVQNINGVQQYIKTYVAPPDADPDSLVGPDFVYDGYTYTFSSITKDEHSFEDTQQHTETLTVETSKKDLATVLESLPNTVKYDDGNYTGTLALDHSTIKTEAAGYKSGSYTVTATREIGDLPDNDMSRIPATTVKDGVTINLSSVDWQVQGTSQVDGFLMPTLYKAIAHYSGTAGYKTATGYVTTAEYSGTVSCSKVDSVTYTVTYEGEKLAEGSSEEADRAENAERGSILDWSGLPYAAGAMGAAALGLGTALIVSHKKRANKSDTDYLDYEDMEDGNDN